MEAWAAVEHGNGIVTDTISSSEGESRKKWLTARGGYKVPDGMGDFAVREHFRRLSLGVVEIKRVTVDMPPVIQAARPALFSTLFVGHHHCSVTPFEDIGAAEAEFNKAQRGETDDPVIAGFLFAVKSGLLDHFYRAPE